MLSSAQILFCWPEILQGGRKGAVAALLLPPPVAARSALCRCSDIYLILPRATRRRFFAFDIMRVMRARALCPSRRRRYYVAEQPFY